MRTLRAGILTLALPLAALGACGDAAPHPTAPAVDEGPAVALRRVSHTDLACTDPCGVRFTYEARRVDTGAPAATTLHLAGDGWFPAQVRTSLPDGRATFTWEFPRPQQSGTRYELEICPTVGECAEASATIYLSGAKREP